MNMSANTSTKKTLMVVMLLTGCYEPPVSRTAIDQCLRRQIFQECLKQVPTGPTHTVASNDWDEVVRACESAAYYQSLRARNQIKPECSGGE